MNGSMSDSDPFGNGLSPGDDFLDFLVVWHARTHTQKCFLNVGNEIDLIKQFII